MSRRWKATLLTFAAVLAAVCFGCNHNLTTNSKSDDESGRSKLQASTTRIEQLLAQSVVDADETKVDPHQQKINLLFARADLMESGNEPEKAIKLFGEAVQLDPQHAAALHRLAVLNVQAGQPKSADQYFRAAVDADDHSTLDEGNLRAKLYCDYGYFCYLTSRWEDAEAYLSRAIEFDASLKEAHNNLGILAARRGDRAKANQHFKQAGCSAAESLNNMAFARMLENDFDVAAATYRLALNRDPKQPIALAGAKVANRLAHGSESKEKPAGAASPVVSASHVVRVIGAEESD